MDCVRDFIFGGVQLNCDEIAKRAEFFEVEMNKDDDVNSDAVTEILVNITDDTDSVTFSMSDSEVKEKEEAAAVLTELKNALYCEEKLDERVLGSTVAECAGVKDGGDMMLKSESRYNLRPRPRRNIVYTYTF